MSTHCDTTGLAAKVRKAMVHAFQNSNYHAFASRANCRNPTSIAMVWISSRLEAIGSRLYSTRRALRLERSVGIGQGWSVLVIDWRRDKDVANMIITRIRAHDYDTMSAALGNQSPRGRKFELT
eukprot:3593508-Amphidinium_carterae.2